MGFVRGSRAFRRGPGARWGQIALSSAEWLAGYQGQSEIAYTV